jgi:predicted acyl esterase
VARDTFVARHSSHGTFALQRRVFDYTLKGTGDFSRTQPKIELTIRDANDRTAGRRAESEWPLARTQWRKLYLDSAASTLGASAAERETTATYRAFSEGITFSDAAAR